MKKYLALPLIGLMISCTPAAAQTACGPRDAVLEALSERYGEEQQAIGLSQNGVFEVFANEETGTWTVIITRPDGISCLATSGQAYEEFDSTPEGDLG